MVLGLKGKNIRRSSTVHIDYEVHVHEVKPWPPSQSLRSLRSVLIQWEGGDHRSSGSTNSVTPSIGSIVGEGKIEFDESFKVPVTLIRDTNFKSDSFQKNCLELNLFEARRDDTVKGQSLATAVIDFSEYGLLREGLRVDIPMNCKRSFKNTDRPVLWVTIQPIFKARAGSSSRDSLSRVMSMESNGRESVSALMNEEYAEEAESDEDDFSRSSSAAASSSNGGLRNQNEENLSNKQSDTSEGNGGKHVTASKLHQTPPHENMNRSLSQSSSLDLSSDLGSPQNNHTSKPHSPNSSTGEFIKGIDSNGVHSSSSPSAKECSNMGMESNVNEDSPEIINGAQEHESSGPYGGDTQDNGNSNEKAREIGRILLEEENIDSGDSRDDESPNTQDNTRRKSFGSDTSSVQGNLGTSENTPKSERSKLVKSVRADSGRNGHRTEIKESIAHSQNGLASLRLKERKEAKVFPRDTRSAILESKLQQLELRIKMLEGELTEAAAVEASLYSVVAEHGSSGSKVHAPARRLARMYLHACKETSLSRRANAATSAVSGLVLVAKACGNDVPRLTFWLSNTVVLRTILVQASGKLGQVSSSSTNGINARKIVDGRNSPLKWKISSSGKREEIKLLDSRSTDWEEPRVFTRALEKIEAWIFSRLVESIWWQTLTPHMQSVDSKTTEKESDSESTKVYNRSFSSSGQEQGNFSLDLWRKAFRDSLERLCPVRAAGHECGCLPMLARIVMEQSVSRLDVAMFNAILRESGDDIPTDPVSDPIGDPRVLPIPAGTSSFEAGAQLKNAIGNWSRWLTDTFGIDDDDPLEEPNSNEDERQEKTFKSFHFLNALSDLMMLPKDMLLNKSIRKEVCPKFGAPLIKRVLDNFVPDEFCPDPIPDVVFEALESEDSTKGEESATNFPCDAAAILYTPPSTASIAAIIGELGSQSHLRRSGSSILRKSYTSDDELEELNSPLALILNGGPRSSPTRSGWIFKERNSQSTLRYELLRDVWMESEI